MPGRPSDPDWSPATYWPALPSDEDLLQRVSGARRRALVRDALASGDLSSLDPALLRETLTTGERRALLQAHPHLALGEYLPELEDADLPEGEVEIARLYLASGIGNTISVRARRAGGEIALRAVDEFGDKLSIMPRRIPRPLTNAELLAAVKTLEWEGPLAYGLVWDTREAEAEVDAEAAAEFIDGESELYPAFAELVEEDNRRWLDELFESSDEDDF